MAGRERFNFSFFKEIVQRLDDPFRTKNRYMVSEINSIVKYHNIC